MPEQDITECGALVISLDCELLWGVRDLCTVDDPYRIRIINARRAIPAILDLFEQNEVAATWAIVGFLFAKNRSELDKYSPKIRPMHSRNEFDPYSDSVGLGEWDNPLHYAPSLIAEIKKRDRQEIATHTFSHYYCLEHGQTEESFAADLRSALHIARRYGVAIQAIVFPRNQHNPRYDEILVQHEILSYRGIEVHPMYDGRRQSAIHKRLYRLVDSYINLSGSHLFSWDEVLQESGLCNVRSSRLLRPKIINSEMLERMRLKRVIDCIYEAAKSKKIFHLWWHPHNFGFKTEENIKGLEEILIHFNKCREHYGMLSLNMSEVTDIVRRRTGLKDFQREAMTSKNY